ncbi:MAG: HIRAN domain-containing protein [Acidimicrobiales bacterium]|nr:HIRAN domain-containing protein [Acidimicrobiales bacterium]
MLRPVERQSRTRQGAIVTTGHQLVHESSGLPVTPSAPELRRAGIVLVHPRPRDPRDADMSQSFRDALAAAAFSPGSRVQVLPDPSEPHDPEAVGIWSGDASLRLGWVPNVPAADLSRRLRAGEVRIGVALNEGCALDGTRLGIEVLIAPPEVVARLGAALL